MRNTGSSLHDDFQTKSTDRQIGGDHYKNLAIQPVEFIEKNGLGYCIGNIIKYLCRYKKKNGVQDLKKAKHYIEMLLEMETDRQIEVHNPHTGLPKMPKTDKYK